MLDVKWERSFNLRLVFWTTGDICRSSDVFFFVRSRIPNLCCSSGDIFENKPPLVSRDLDFEGVFLQTYP